MKSDTEENTLSTTLITLRDIENEPEREISESEDALLTLIAKIIVDIIIKEEL